jgi:peptide/nickel transport system permease protein
MELIGERLPNSIKLAAAAMGFCVLIAIPLGVAAAVRRGRWMDTVAKLIAVSGQAAPPFWLGIVLIEIFAIRLEILPVAGMRGFTAYILPAFTMGWFITAGIMRLLRSSMIDVLDSDFMTMARAKGVSEKRAIFKHALRNSLIPVVSLGGIYFATLITMAVIVETVFAWPGLGRLAYEAIRQRDFPVIQGVVLMAAVIVITVNMFIDMLYAFLDPRIRYR